MVKEKMTCPYGVRPAKDTATTISSGMTKKMLSQSRAALPAVYRFSSSLYFHLVSFVPPDADAFVGRPAFDVVKVLICDYGLVRVVKTDKYFVDSAVEDNIDDGAVKSRLGVRCGFVFAFSFFAEVQLFRQAKVSVSVSKKLLSPMNLATNFVEG